MNCVPCLECGDGTNITRENLDRWTDSVKNVLGSSEGRAHFKRYLESRSLDDSLNTVEFWERCVRIMPARPAGGDSPPHLSEPVMHHGAVRLSGGECSSSSSPRPRTQPVKEPSPPQQTTVSEYLHRELDLLVEFANNYVNLDLAQMRCLYRMLKMTKEADVVETLTQAKQSAMELLADDYQLFREHLLKNQSLLRQ